MKWISFLFAALTIGSAFQHLESVTATTMLVTWIILAIRHASFNYNFIYTFKYLSSLALTNMSDDKKGI